MTFGLTVDGPRWRAHQERVVDAVDRAAGAATDTGTGKGIVPVVKAGGYGLGQSLLVEQAVRLGVDTVAVGTVWEIDEAAAQGTHDILVLEPFEPRDTAAAREWWRMGQQLHAGRVVRTVASREALLTLADGPGAVRVLLEASTSMTRFGMDEAALLATLADSRVRSSFERGRVLVEGLALHLPMRQPVDGLSEPGTARLRETVRWAGLWQAETDVWSGHNSPEPRVWVSHLDDRELTEAARTVPDVVLRARVGTRLWLGDRSALRAGGTVLAVHPVPTGTRVGYRQRTGPGDGTLVVVSGGTSHGIGLSAPTPATTLRQRVVTAGTGALDATGRALSPFTWAGKQRWFAEPPHQHHSMIWLPRGCVIPAVGDRMPAEVRFTTSRFDSIQVTD